MSLTAMNQRRSWPLLGESLEDRAEIIPKNDGTPVHTLVNPYSRFVRLDKHATPCCFGYGTLKSKR